MNNPEQVPGLAEVNALSNQLDESLRQLLAAGTPIPLVMSVLDNAKNSLMLGYYDPVTEEKGSDHAQ